jgi:hypothetical protein
MCVKAFRDLKRVGLIVMLLLSLQTGCATRASGAKTDEAVPRTKPPQSLLVPSESEFNLGAFSKTERRELELWINNPGDIEIRLEKITTSCECFSVVLDKMVLSAGEKVRALAILDPGHEPSFTGSLRLDATGIEAGSGRKAFAIFIDVTLE